MQVSAGWHCEQETCDAELAELGSVGGVQVHGGDERDIWELLQVYETVLDGVHDLVADDRIDLKFVGEGVELAEIVESLGVGLQTHSSVDTGNGLGVEVFHEQLKDARLLFTKIHALGGLPLGWEHI